MLSGTLYLVALTAEGFIQPLCAMALIVVDCYSALALVRDRCAQRRGTVLAHHQAGCLGLVDSQAALVDEIDFARSVGAMTEQSEAWGLCASVLCFESTCRYQPSSATSR
jgi:hypothetical protein